MLPTTTSRLLPRLAAGRSLTQQPQQQQPQQPCSPKRNPLLLRPSSLLDARSSRGVSSAASGSCGGANPLHQNTAVHSSAAGARSTAASGAAAKGANQVAHDPAGEIYFFIFIGSLLRNHGRRRVLLWQYCYRSTSCTTTTRNKPGGDH